MKGYFNRPKETAEIIDSEGWLHSGDLGYYDEEGHFYVVDRLKELIKVKGYQVAPAELEEILRSHPDIDDAAVVGVPDDRAGEVPRAYIVRRSPHISEEDVKKFVAAKLSEHKHLKGGVLFLTSIPKSPSGKILRRELKGLL
jgi:acyl-CoA synthetase (AMP-forming)/AMP-acid ligase II